jgi:hypothetical protein
MLTPHPILQALRFHPSTTTLSIRMNHASSRAAQFSTTPSLHSGFSIDGDGCSKTTLVGQTGQRIHGAFEAFASYLDMRADRSTGKVALALCKGKQLSDRWSSAHEWVARAKDFDRWEDGELRPSRQIPHRSC